MASRAPVCAVGVMGLTKGGRDVERYRLLGIEHDGRESASARVVSREPNNWGIFPLHTFNSGDEVVLAADAQATIAALQAERDEYKTMYACLTGETYDNPIADLKAQLTQRTAELEAANTLLYKKNCALGRAETSINDLQAELERVRAALERIARYGNDGICPFGCDTPHIAQAALTATSQPTAAEVHQRMFDHGDATSQEGQG